MEVSRGISAESLDMPPLNILPSAIRVHAGLASRARNIWFRLLGVEIRGYAWLRRISIPRCWESITLEDKVALDDGVVLLCSGPPKRDRLVIQAGTYINRYTMIDVSEEMVIGRDCMIGPHCYLTDHDHVHEMNASSRRSALRGAPVRLGSNVWLGAGVIVLKGVTIGDNAVVGAGSVVTKNVAPSAVVVGVPARLLELQNGGNCAK